MDDIIFKSASGKILTLQDLDGIDGTVKWSIPGDGDIPSAAVIAHNSGRVYGQRGESEKAIAAFAEAAQLAPDWPYPFYDLAYTYLLAQDYTKAIENYQKVNSLSPQGFYTAQTALHYLSLEQQGKYPAGLYLYYLSHEWGRSPEQQLAIFSSIVEKFPDYSPAWQKLCGIYTQTSDKLMAIEQGLAGLPDNSTKGYLVINKALLIFNSGQTQDAINILGELALGIEWPGDIKIIAKQTLSMLLRGEH